MRNILSTGVATVIFVVQTFSVAHAQLSPQCQAATAQINAYLNSQDVTNQMSGMPTNITNDGMCRGSQENAQILQTLSNNVTASLPGITANCPPEDTAVYTNFVSNWQQQISSYQQNANATCVSDSGPQSTTPTPPIEGGSPLDQNSSPSGGNSNQGVQ